MAKGKTGVEGMSTDQRIKFLVGSGAFRNTDFKKDAQGRYTSTARHRALRWAREYAPYINSTHYVLTRPRSGERRRALNVAVPSELKRARSPVVPIRTGADASGEPRKIKSVRKLKGNRIAVKVEGRTWIFQNYTRTDLQEFAKDPVEEAKRLVARYGTDPNYHLRVGRGADPAGEFIRGEDLEDRMVHWATYETKEGVGIAPVFEGVIVELPD